ncbi:dimethyladenosine transferase 1, mitochondrial-like [Lineus longissimus]|uniref:dimethyladenosine transferase 1, mitochondrial-like n=1 Tax=Lineus longissimus TaxID=88925 RepID=UPI00315D0BB1
MMRLPPLPSVRDIIRIYKLRALKQLSQNFLLNERITRKIVKCAGKIKDKFVCEVGPGPGGITRAILEAGPKAVVVVEKDRRFFPTLKMLQESVDSPLVIVHGDILSFEMDNVFPEYLKKPWEDKPPDIHIIGNLPFSVSTALIVKWMEDISERRGAWRYGRTPLTLTFQKEVGERMVADTEDEQRSRLSILCQYLCEVESKFIIPGSAFVPKPEVDVAVVHFVPRVEPRIKVPFKRVEKVIRLTFQHRNKVLKNCIDTFFPPQRPDLVEEIFRRSMLHPGLRPRQLTLGDFRTLCDIYHAICEREPEIASYHFRSRKSVTEWNKRKAIWQSIAEQGGIPSRDILAEDCDMNVFQEPLETR